MPSLNRTSSINSNNSISSNAVAATDYENDTLRIAVLGSDEVGKTSFINRLTMKYVPESHYPTLKVSNWLFQFEPVNELTRLILDEHKHVRMLYKSQQEKKNSINKVNKCIYQTPILSDHLVISNSLFTKELNSFTKFKSRYFSSSGDYPVDQVSLMKPQNPFYRYNETFTGLYDNHSLGSSISNNTNLTHHLRTTETPNSFLINPTLSPISIYSSVYNSISNDIITPNVDRILEEDDIIPIYDASHNNLITKEQTIKKYTPILPNVYYPPYISNILIDIIDTPPFNVTSMIPFLEVSLFRENLGVPYLHEERMKKNYNENVGTMLTFSGSSELNGKIDAYVLVYSCYPVETEPPIYHIESNESTGDNNSDQNSNENGDVLLKDIITMKEILVDAWRSYREYKLAWEQGNEGDVYSVMYNLRKKWEKIPLSQSKQKKKDKMIDEDMPPIVIVATHTLAELTSPILLEEGKKLAMEWGCSFIAVDNYHDYQCEEALGVIVAESVEYRKKERKLKQKDT
ncbi:hypothetical protein QEN19_003906 [Hanseniaspora menglaensis]